MVSAQLSLFDTAAVIKPTYEVGDRVKLRKKPISATYLKKGDVVEIAVVHPIDGSIKFWNERSERWEFIHPDEIGSIFKSESATDSPTPAEVAVGESNCPHSETDTIPSVDAAISCYAAKPDKIALPLFLIFLSHLITISPSFNNLCNNSDNSSTDLNRRCAIYSFAECQTNSIKL
jgi:hypothetical protein